MFPDWTFFWEFPEVGSKALTRTKRRILVFLAFFLFSAAAFVASSGISLGQLVLEPPRSAIPADLFGMHIHRVVVKDRRFANKTPWPPVPFAGWRLWDSYVAWGQLEKKKGEWNFETLDKYLELADEHQVELLLLLGLSPRWASARPTEESKYYRGAAAEPENIEDWRNYVRTVATRYKGRLHYYELWNEPNLKGFYSGTVDKMLELSREAYRILKEVDPGVVVLSPSATKTSRGTGITWLEEYLSKGGGDYADIIGYHFYVKPDPPETMVPAIRQVQDLMAKYGVGDKPLWNTETGWMKPKPFPSDELGAAYVARSYILNWAAGVPRFYWYDWDYNPFMSLHMTEEDSTTLKPAAIAYEEVQKWLVGARMNNCENSGNTWTCQLTREGGYKAWIVWNTEEELTFKVPKRWGADRTRNLAGHRRKLTGDRLKISPSPLLLEKLA